MVETLIRQLGAPVPPARLDALREIAHMWRTGALAEPVAGANVNNHIHTIYSFSPYSPSQAAYLARASGLSTAGIMDHDSVGGAREFIEAGHIAGLPVTVGFECRCSVAGTPFEGRRINNPDQKSVAYMAMHAIPHHMLDEAERFLAPLREKRNARNRQMSEKLSKKLAPYGIGLDFEKDVLPLSQHESGGSVTERHLLYALASAITADEMQRYFLLGIFKSGLIESIYVDADEELPHITQFVSIAEKLGAIPAYAYLGDVGVSVTGDKASQPFEDAYLEDLISYMAKIGVRAVTYMPARNSASQLDAIMRLSDAHGMFQISGEDINSPLQSFICEKIETPEFRHLIKSAWALIGHEKAAARAVPEGMFAPGAVARIPALRDRIDYFSRIGKE